MLSINIGSIFYKTITLTINSDKILNYSFLILNYFLTFPWGVHSTNPAFVCTPMIAFS